MLGFEAQGMSFSLYEEKNHILQSEFRGPCGSEYEDDCLLGCCTCSLVEVY
jgi:hypothetical protein